MSMRGPLSAASLRAPLDRLRPSCGGALCWLLQPVARNRVPGGAGDWSGAIRCWMEGRWWCEVRVASRLCEVRVAPRLLKLQVRLGPTCHVSPVCALRSLMYNTR